MTDILRGFEYDVLKPHLQSICRDFYYLAHDIVAGLPDNPERALALAKLLEARDAAIRTEVLRKAELAMVADQINDEAISLLNEAEAAADRSAGEGK